MTSSRHTTGRPLSRRPASTDPSSCFWISGFPAWTATRLRHVSGKSKAPRMPSSSPSPVMARKTTVAVPGRRALTITWLNQLTTMCSIRSSDSHNIVLISYYFKNGIGLQPLQQPGERIMRRGEGGPGLHHAFGLRAADSSLGSDQEVDVRLIGAVRCVHNRILRSVNALINCTCAY